MCSIGRRQGVLVTLLILTLLVPGLVTAAPAGQPTRRGSPDIDKAIFFAADGMRQEAIEQYARLGIMPTMEDLLDDGATARGGGLLTQAPPNTGAGWYSLATGAWSGAHGSTNNTFHINGTAFISRTAAFDPGVLQAESLAQAAERAGKKVAQIEWAGGRNARINGPTVDFRGFFSGRG